MPESLNVELQSHKKEQDRHVQFKSSKGWALWLIMICALGLFPGAALAGGFPGKGDPGAWSDALPYYNLANRYMSKERYEDAVAKYQEAIARYEYDPDFYINLGLAYRKLGDYANTEQALKKAIALNDKDWVAWTNLANVYLKQNRLKETIDAFQKVLKLNPPAAEKAATEKDIADIKKIMQMQSGQTAAAPESAVKAKGTSKPAARNKAAHVGGGKNADLRISNPKNPAPGHHPEEDTSPPGAPSDTGWD